MSIARREFLSGLTAAGGVKLFRPTGADAQTTAGQQPYPHPDLRERSIPARFRYSKPVIDAHTHFYAKEFVDLVIKEGAANGAQVAGPDENGNFRVRAIGGGYGAGYSRWGGSTFSRSLSDLDYQVKAMDERGSVDLHSLGMTHPKVYWAPPEFGLRLSEAQNNGVSVWV